MISTTKKKVANTNKNTEGVSKDTKHVYKLNKQRTGNISYPVNNTDESN